MKHNYLRIGGDTPDLKPPFWAYNGHVHTIVASQMKAPDIVVPHRIEIPTPDDDFLELDVITPDDSGPVVALFHGLEGSSERVYIRRLMSYLYSLGISSVALNFRGCGSRLNHARRFYHSGETTDYHTLFSWISKNMPGRKVCATGFSLGANALIKYLAEFRESTPVLRAVAVSPPYQLREGSLAMQQGFNRVYEYRFLRTLRRKLQLKRIRYPDLPRFTGRSLYEFDDQITAPVHGFRDAEHYYEHCSSGSFLSGVSTPLLLIHSWQDPICPLEFAPFDAIEANGSISTCFTQEGGHVGFLHRDGDWLNMRIGHFLTDPDE